MRLEYIGQSAFSYCYALTTVAIPSTVTEIGDSAFFYCTELLSVELPEGLLRIGDTSFRDCGALVNISVASSIPQIGSLVFGGCTKLSQVVEANNRHSTLLSTVKNRFDDLPVHKICYHQGHRPLETNLENLNQAIRLDPTSAEKADTFGMTPFHILALSAKPSLDIFQSLLIPSQSNNALDYKDIYGNTPLHYACRNRVPNSIEVIKISLHATFDDRLECLGLQRWIQDITNEIYQFNLVKQFVIISTDK